MNNNEVIINDLNNITTDIEEICKSIKSSSLTSSTNNLLVLIETLSNNINTALNEEGDSNEY